MVLENFMKSAKVMRVRTCFMLLWFQWSCLERSQRLLFKCSPTFNVKGIQVSSTVTKSHVDFNDNPSDAKKIGLTAFLTNTNCTWILWWPQTSNIVDLKDERLLVWQAERIEPSSISKESHLKCLTVEAWWWHILSSIPWWVILKIL